MRVAFRTTCLLFLLTTQQVRAAGPDTPDGTADASAWQGTLVVEHAVGSACDARVPSTPQAVWAVERQANPPAGMAAGATEFQRGWHLWGTMQSAWLQPIDDLPMEGGLSRAVPWVIRFSPVSQALADGRATVDRRGSTVEMAWTETPRKGVACAFVKARIELRRVLDAPDHAMLISRSQVESRFVREGRQLLVFEGTRTAVAEAFEQRSGALLSQAAHPQLFSAGNAGLLVKLGDLATMVGKPEQAQSFYRLAIDHYLGSSPQRVLDAATVYGRMALARGVKTELGKALMDVSQGIKLLEDRQALTSGEGVALLHHRGSLWLRSGHMERAADDFAAALDADTRRGADADAIALSMSNYAHALRTTGALSKARELLEGALDHLQQAGSAGNGLQALIESSLQAWRRQDDVQSGRT